MSADDERQSDDTLAAEASDIFDRYWSLRKELTTWSIKIGPIRISKPVDTNSLAIAFIIWHAATFTTGVLVTIFWANNKALGIALVVGSLFGFGSFLSQVWSQGMAKEREFLHKIEHEESIARFRIVAKQVRDVERRIDERLNGETS
ncbi:hypothetical protein ACIA5G_41120 [Amycolatopsis sp. NPDC051758]|uniref:hypothetical protein n=1 Tax=Amycolatopsis sp. NPDC051758 TaxID=3363935 RepID=UPI0037B31D51